MGKLGWALYTRLDNRADLGLGRLSLCLCELLEPNRPSGKSPGQGNNTKSAETAGAGELLPVLFLRTREVNRRASKKQLAKALRQGKINS
jgi:hypothetical protein